MSDNHFYPTVFRLRPHGLALQKSTDFNSIKKQSLSLSFKII